MAVTRVWTDRSDYCRYQQGYSVIAVTGTLDAGSSGAQVVVALNRTDAYGQLATQTVMASGTTFTATFDLASAAVNDTNGINRAVQGDYTVTATQGGVTFSAPLTVSLVSVADLRKKWCYGQTLYASEVVLPKAQ